MYFSLFSKMVSINARETMRDFLTLFFSFIFPLIFLVLFGFMSKPREIAPTRIAMVVNADATQSESFIRTFTRNPALSVKDMTQPAALKSLETGAIDAVVRLFMTQGQLEAEITSTGKSSPYLRALLEKNMSELVSPELSEKSQTRVHEKKFEANTNFGTTFLIPGMTAMALLQLALFGTANPVMMARSRGTLVHFTLTPMPKSIIVGSLVVVRLAIAAAQIVILLGIAVFILGISLDSSVISVLLVHALGSLMLIALGFFIAGVVPGQAVGGSIVMIVNFLMLGLGDVFFPSTGVPGLSVISGFMPITYFTDASRQLIVGSVGRFPLALDICVMLTLATVFLALTVKTFNFGMKKA
jgi:ABC-2 type transport system permease protein